MWIAYVFSKAQRGLLAILVATFLMGLGVTIAAGARAVGEDSSAAPPQEYNSGPSQRIDDSQRPAPAQDVEAGEEVYRERCSFCHGEKGDGFGPVAPYLNPRPRDFTSGLFKLRTTSDGEPPLDTDMIRTVKKGIPGTAMPSWEGTLSDEEIANVVAYIKTFSPYWFDPEFPPEVVVIGEPPPVDEQLIAQGKQVYEEAQCWKCHGKEGRSDGESAPTLTDDWGYPIRPANLTKGWRYKGGTTVKDIYTRFSTGMNGTPMPTFFDSLSEEERWALAAYVKSLIREEPDVSEVVIQSRLISGDLPTDPDDPRWAEAPGVDIPLIGQVVARPRWQNPAVDLITVRSLHNGQEVAFLLEWDDPFKDVVHQETDEVEEVFEDTYVNWELYAFQEHRYRDAVAIQFPPRLPEGPRKPHFLRGKKSEPVNLWMWKADAQATGGGTGAVEELVARGHLLPAESSAAEAGEEGTTSSLRELMSELLAPQPPESQNVKGSGVWRSGTWKVVMRRALDPGDSKDTPLEPGKLIPVAFQAWDGSSGEWGLMMSTSSWYFVLLEAPTPTNVYVYTVIGVMLAAAVEGWLVRRVRARPTKNA